jgi:phosphoheptose isomerase
MFDLQGWRRVLKLGNSRSKANAVYLGDERPNIPE